MADPALHPQTLSHYNTQLLKQIAIDYTPDACTHFPDSNTIKVTFDHRGGSRWRTPTRFLYGTFSSLIQCPSGNTSGLNFNLYLSSLEEEGEHRSQDEIDFEILGKDMTIVETNYYSNGTGNKEESHDLGFNCSEGFHEYVIKWSKDVIEWIIDGRRVRRVDRKEGEGFPKKPMYLYSSVWNASHIDEGRWSGKYFGCDVPYVCVYKNIRVPISTVHQETTPLKQIAIDYTPDACTYCPDSNTIKVTFDHRGGSRWRTRTRFLYGTFSSLIQCPRGNTSGLNFNLYLSSLEGDKSQDEIDFEILGKDMTIIETNYYSNGTGNKEESHDLGFNCSEGFHEYVIKWSKDVIEWFIDGRRVRRVERKEGEGFPKKPMYLYSSVWDASYIDKGRWSGKYVGCDVPYVLEELT